MTEQEKIIQEKKKHHSWKHYFRLGLTAFLTVAASISFFFLLYRWGEIADTMGKIVKSAEPIIIGLVLAYLLMPIKESIEKPVYRLLISNKVKEQSAKTWAKSSGIIGSVIFLFVIIGVLIASLGPALFNSIVGLWETLPGYISSFVVWISESGLADNEMSIFIGNSIMDLTSELESWAKTEILPLAQQYITQITSGVLSIVKTILNFIIGIIAMVYVMSIKETLVGQSKKIVYALFSPKKGNVIIETVRKSSQIFGGFVIGKIIDSAIIGVIAYVGCLLMNIPSALLVAFIIGVTNIIPFFGPFIGAIPTILLVLIQSPIHALYLAAFILILQQVDGNIIGPKILGESTGLSAFWVLTSILIAGGLFGFLGMLLGVPVFAVFYYILQQILNWKMEKKKLSKETKKYIHLISIDAATLEMKYDEMPEQKEEVIK